MQMTSTRFNNYVRLLKEGAASDITFFKNMMFTRKFIKNGDEEGGYCPYTLQ
jgi:hypothetical protein